MVEQANPASLPAEVVAQLEANWHRVSDVYLQVMPIFTGSGEVSLSDWRPAALACLARGHYAQQSLFALGSDRKLDAAVLARVAFEHLVTFAWVMVDPAAHHRRFLRSEHQHLTEQFKDLDAQAISVSISNRDASLADLEKYAAPRDQEALRFRNSRSIRSPLRSVLRGSRHYYDLG